MRKRLNRDIQIALVIFGIPIALIALWLFPALKSNEEWRFNARLLASMRNSHERIPLSQLTDFAWTRVCPVDSYIGPNAIESAAGISFSLSDSIRWFFYAPSRENQTAFIFLTPNGILPIKVPSTREAYLQIDGPRPLSKHLCDHNVETKLQVWNCTKYASDPRASKQTCHIALW
jgi:hypothetical protein